MGVGTRGTGGGGLSFAGGCARVSDPGDALTAVRARC